MGMRQNLESMLAAGQDNALLRYTLGNECLKAGEPELAAKHLRCALEHDPGYTAAWRQLGRALDQAGDARAALESWQRGIEVAAGRGDVQAGKEMEVFARRIRKRLSEQQARGD